MAGNYGLKVRKNGTACCPFHDDKHPSLKIGENYRCFACGAGGDAVDYVSRICGLSQYHAALKLIDDFSLPVGAGKHSDLSEYEKARIHKDMAEHKKIIHIKKRFHKWCGLTIDILKDCLWDIKAAGCLIKIWQTDILHLSAGSIQNPIDSDSCLEKFWKVVFSDEYAQMLHAEPVINYWLDILCIGSVEEKQELFLEGRKEVAKIAETVRCSSGQLMERDWGCDGC